MCFASMDLYMHSTNIKANVICKTASKACGLRNSILVSNGLIFPLNTHPINWDFRRYKGI